MIIKQSSLKTIFCLIPGIILSTWFTACINQDPNAQIENTQAKMDPKDKDGVITSYKDGYLYTKVTMKNGKKNGLAKKFYKNGKVNTEITYKDNLKVGTSKWFYTNGKLYRETPYKNGKIHGIQVKYHKNGLLKARIPYDNGNRKIGLIEKSLYGNDVSNYPSIKYKQIDERSTNKKLTINLNISNNSKNVVFYEGRLKDSIFDPGKLNKIITKNGKGSLHFIEEPDFNGAKAINIIGIYKTKLGNKKILQRVLRLPSAHLKRD